MNYIRVKDIAQSQSDESIEEKIDLDTQVKSRLFFFEKLNICNSRSASK